jgi:MRG-binding protein
MHKHFRMIAISEHLRNHGFDPDFYTHTRIPHIWEKLRTFYNLDLIDEREHNLDNVEDPSFEERFLEFSLPREDFGDIMLQRAIADPSEAPTSPAQLEMSPQPQSPRKRKRGDTVSKTRASTVEDTEEGTDVASPAPPKSARSARSQKRAAGRAKVEKAETPEPDTAEEEENSDTEDADEESEEESGTPASRSTRGAGSRGRGGSLRGRGRGRRGRGRGG